MMNIFMSAVKFFTVAHRPHFFDTCKPNTMFNCTIGSYVEDFKCTNTEEVRWKVYDASWSFFSGHASAIVFSSFFVIWFVKLLWFSKNMLRKFLIIRYIEKRMKNNSIFFVLFLQTSLACLSFYGAISRVIDNRHHWWDVLAGGIVGLITAYHTVSSLK